MRRPSAVALAGCLLLALPPLTARAQAPPAGGAAAVQFEDSELAPGDRELLTRAAQAVGRWAMVQRIVRAVQAQEAAPLPLERVQAIDAAWQRGEDPEGLATSLAKNECAQALQSLISANPAYAAAFVTDDRGALVCMSQRTSDYWQGDEATWSRAWADGAGAVFVSRRESDASTGLDVFHVAVPIRSAGKVIGVLVAGRIAG